MRETTDFQAGDRRKSTRQSTLGNISVFRKDGSRSYDGKIYNICRDGMSIVTDLPLNIMTRVHIKVEQSMDLPPKTRYTGRVVWGTIIQDRDSGNYRYGIQLLGTRQPGSLEQ